MNIGDMIFQLAPLLLLAVIIFAAVAGLRTLKKRKAQLERIEKSWIRSVKRRKRIYRPGATSSTFIRSGSSAYTA